MKTRAVTVHSRSFGPYRKVAVARGERATRRRDMKSGVELWLVTMWHLTLSPCGHTVSREERGAVARPPERVRCDECPAKIEVLA